MPPDVIPAVSHNTAHPLRTSAGFVPLVAVSRTRLVDRKLEGSASAGYSAAGSDFEPGGCGEGDKARVRCVALGK